MKRCEKRRRQPFAGNLQLFMSNMDACKNILSTSGHRWLVRCHHGHNQRHQEIIFFLRLRFDKSLVEIISDLHINSSHYCIFYSRRNMFSVEPLKMFLEHLMGRPECKFILGQTREGGCEWAFSPFSSPDVVRVIGIPISSKFPFLS